MKTKSMIGFACVVILCCNAAIAAPDARPADAGARTKLSDYQKRVDARIAEGLNAIQAAEWPDPAKEVDVAQNMALLLLFLTGPISGRKTILDFNNVQRREEGVE